MRLEISRPPIRPGFRRMFIGLGFGGKAPAPRPRAVEGEFVGSASPDQSERSAAVAPAEDPSLTRSPAGRFRQVWGSQEIVSGTEQLSGRRVRETWKISTGFARPVVERWNMPVSFL